MNNTFISNYRAGKNMKLINLDESAIGNDPMLKARNSETVSSWGSNPEQYLINKLLDEDIRRSINSLPEEFRMAVILCDVENLTYKEISEITRVPVGTVRSRLSRGRAILQKKLHHAAIEMGIVQEQKNNTKNIICNCN
jgi:RNA polymerase sigma-70 factor (ECF subfamily)